jgi:hypothetical protein
MEDNWLKVYSAGQLYQVELVKGILDQSGIESVILNQSDSEFLLGEVELYVETENFELAKNFIHEFHKGE